MGSFRKGGDFSSPISFERCALSSAGPNSCNRKPKFAGYDFFLLSKSKPKFCPESPVFKTKQYLLCKLLSACFSKTTLQWTFEKNNSLNCFRVWIWLAFTWKMNVSSSISRTIPSLSRLIDFNELYTNGNKWESMFRFLVVFILFRFLNKRSFSMWQ